MDQLFLSLVLVRLGIARLGISTRFLMKSQQGIGPYIPDQIQGRLLFLTMLSEAGWDTLGNVLRRRFSVKKPRQPFGAAGAEAPAVLWGVLRSTSWSMEVLIFVASFLGGLKL